MTAAYGLSVVDLRDFVDDAMLKESTTCWRTCRRTSRRRVRGRRSVNSAARWPRDVQEEPISADSDPMVVSC